MLTITVQYQFSILMTSRLEAILENNRCSLKLVKNGYGCWGGGLSFAPPPTSLVSKYNGLLQAMRAGWYPFHSPTSVSFSLSIFLCFAASWTGVDKNIRAICAEHIVTRTFQT